MKTKKEIIDIAKAQLATDYNCDVCDFEKDKNIITENKLLDGRRIYDSDGCFFKLLVFGGRAVISTAPLMMPWCEENLKNRMPSWIFEYNKLRMIDKKLNEFGHEINDIHQYYLPNPAVSNIKPAFDVRWYEKDDILQFKDDDRFEEAFAFDENYPDVLGVAALDGENIMGMAGASKDSKTMWQIGINVLPQYGGRGIGTTLVTLLKDEVLKRGKVPFYGTCQSHILSQNLAVSSGFFPAWAELHSAAVKKQK